jgi:alanyl-tRNA synthetase
VAAGVRRIEAVTGIGALEHYQQQAQILRQLASQLNVGEDGILAQVEKLSQTARQLEKELEAQKRKGALSQADELDALIRESRDQVAREAMVKGNSQVQLVKGVKVAWSRVEGVNRQQLREILDKLRQEIRSGVVVLASVENGDISLIAGITKDLTAKVHAGKLMQALAPMVGGKGGGRPDLAEAGGKDTAALKSALLSIPSLLEGLL